ncbi:type IV secretion system DNA-binding domain-containing protein [Spirosoma migulaei]
MHINQLKIGIWSLTLLLLALLCLEGVIQYNPLLFTPYILLQVFKTGFVLRVGFIILYACCFLLPETSLQAELDRKKQKSLFSVDRIALLLIGGCFLLGCLLLFKFELFPFSYYVELAGLLLVIPSIPFLTHFVKGDQTKYRIPTDKKQIDNPDSFSFRGANGTWVNIPNPARGVGIIGSNGSGKTASVAHQIIAQAAYKNYTGVLFDFKFPSLTEYAYNHYSRSECQVDLAIVNFVDLSRSHRINPLLPELLYFQAYAYEFAAAFYCTLNRKAIREKDFWDTSAISILAGVIWYMKIHYPNYCTLPHVLNMILGHDVYQLIGLLETNYETKTIVASVSTAIRTKAEPQLAGQYGTLQNALGRMNTKEIAWVLSGDDFDINLNDPQHPKLLCIGTKQDIIEALSPVVSLLITASLKQLNNPDKLHSMVLLDEGPQCYIPNLSDLPATARSNKVATIYMAQDISQMIKAYGKEEAFAIISNLNTQLFGKNPNIETGEYVSKLFGKEEMLQRNESQNRSNPNGIDSKSGSHSQGVSFSLQDKALFKPHEVNRMETGEFVGITAETVEPVFHTRLKLPTYTFAEGTNRKLPVFYADVDADLNFERIRVECEAIVKGLIQPENEHQLIAGNLR